MTRGRLTLSMLLLASTTVVVSGFTARKRLFGTPRRPSSSLFYRDDKHHEDIGSSKQETTTTTLSIPVLGPFPEKPPLVLGADTTLTSPTPMQWQALQEAVHIHQQHNNNKKQDGGGEGESGIDAAPLIALMDDYTTQSGVELPKAPGRKTSGRYATIAAVVGMKSESGQIDDLTSVRLVGVGRAALHNFFYQVPAEVREAMDDEGHLILEDSADDENSSEEESQDDDDILKSRVVNHNNIIMAEFDVLTDSLQYSQQQAKDRQAKYAKSKNASPMHAVNEMARLAQKINMLHQDRRKLVSGLQAAQARLDRAREEVSAVLDQKPAVSETKPEPKPAKKRVVEPVAKVQKEPEKPVSNKKNDKPALVAKKEEKQKKKRPALFFADVEELETLPEAVPEPEPVGVVEVDALFFDDDLQDYDGFGALFAQKEAAKLKEVEVLNEFLEEFAEVDEEQMEIIEKAEARQQEPEEPAPKQPLFLELEHTWLVDRDNYGMGSCASSISTIMEIAQAGMDTLKPYYSPERVESDSHYYHVLSFVAMQSLEACLEPAHMAWALTSTNTLERLNQAYEWMWGHYLVLKEEASIVSRELLDCGEECTDLF